MWSFDLISQTMPVINVDDLTDLDKAQMEVTQLKIEVKLERAQVSVEIYSWPDYTKWTTSKLDGHCWYAHFCLIVTKKLFHQVSKCCEEISEYIQSGADEDPLVKGIPEEKNPFKEKGGCVVC